MKDKNKLNAGYGFNRYMVECESRFLNQIFYHFLVLIDTWWNVNEWLTAYNEHSASVLIDTWWNVNQFTNHL